MKNTRSAVWCHVRTHRLLWGLSAKELTRLLGLKSHSHLSKIEHGKRAPNVEVALACQVLFGASPSAMFPHVYAQVEDRVMRNICHLHSALEKTTSLSGLRKRDLCELAMTRATPSLVPAQGV